MATENEPDHLGKTKLGAVIGAGLRRIRETLGLTQKQVAARVGLSAEYYARLERGYALPSVLAFHRIVTRLPVDAAELLGSRDEQGSVRLAVKKEDAAIVGIVDQLRDAPKERVKLFKMLVDELEERQDSD